MCPLDNNHLNEPVSGFLTPADTLIQADKTLGEALASLRSRKLRSRIIYFYVIDEEGRLVGVLSTRALLLNDPSRMVRDLMSTDVIRLDATTTLEHAMEEFAVHRLLSLPVVDPQGQLLGVVDVQLYTEEMMDMAGIPRRDDIFQFIGMSIEATRQQKPSRGFRLRMPWLLCNLASGIVCAIVAAVFSSVLEAVVLLAMFIPLVLTLSESISMQAMTASLGFLHGPGVPWGAVRARAHVEWRTAAMLGLGSALLVAIASVFFGGAAMPAGAILPPAMVLLVAISLSMTLSAMVGLMMPLLLHACKLDPRVASGPVVLMIADVVATASYLGLGAWWLM